MKKMIFVCLAFCMMAVIIRVYMAGGLGGIIDLNSDGDNQSATVPKNVNAVSTDKDVAVYKWRDENGVMHFGEVPPDSNVMVEKIELKANKNVVQAVAVKKEEEGNNEIKQVSVTNPYTPEGMSQLINQTKEFAESLNKQQENKKKMMDGMRQH